MNGTDDTKKTSGVTTEKQIQFDSTGTPMFEHDSVTEKIVDVVAELTGTDPMNLDPLHDAIDVDALEDLFAPKRNDRPRAGGIIVFVYGGCTITVHGTDRVTVRLGEAELG